MSESREICRIVTGAASMLSLTEKQATEYSRAVSCSNCGDAFSKDNYKTHHHCQISGKYLIAACNRCNLNLRPLLAPPNCRENEIILQLTSGQKSSTDRISFSPYCFTIYNITTPILSPNTSNENTSRAAIQVTRPRFDDIKITPLNSEKYISFQIGNLRFLDFYQFLSTSLEQLVSLPLKAGRENFVYTSKHLGSDEEFTQNGSRKPLCHRSRNSTIPSKTSR